MLLDEPTTGLDPQARHMVWERLYQLKKQGVTLILTTHYMDEAEQLCDRLVVMDKARIVAEGSPRSLIERLQPAARCWSCASSDRDDARTSRAWATASSSAPSSCPTASLLYTDDGEATAEALHADGIRPVSQLVRRSSLEDVFLRLTGRRLIE